MRHHKGAFSLLVLEVALGFVMLTHTLIMARYYFRAPRPSDRDARGRAGGRAPPLPSPARRRGGARDGARRPRGARPHRRGRRGDRHGAAARRGHVSDRADAAGRRRASISPGRCARRPAIVGGARPAVDRRDGPRRRRSGRARRRRDAGAADRDARPSSSSARSTTPSGRPSTAAPSGAAAWSGVVRDFAFRGGWLPSATSIVIVAAEPVTEHEIVYVMRAPAGRRAAVIEAARTRARRRRATPTRRSWSRRSSATPTRFSTISSRAR